MFVLGSVFGSLGNIVNVVALFLFAKLYYENQSLNRVAYFKASGSRCSLPREHITGLSMCTSLLYVVDSCCTSVLQDRQLQVTFTW